MGILKRIREVSSLEPKNLEQIGLKLMEEAGECAQAILSYGNLSGCSYKELTLNDVREECIDVILVAMSMLYKLDTSDDVIEDIANKKITKWESKRVVK